MTLANRATRGRAAAADAADQRTHVRQAVMELLLVTAPVVEKAAKHRRAAARVTSADWFRATAIAGTIVTRRRSIARIAVAHRPWAMAADSSIAESIRSTARETGVCPKEGSGLWRRVMTFIVASETGCSAAIVRSVFPARTRASNRTFDLGRW